MKWPSLIAKSRKKIVKSFGRLALGSEVNISRSSQGQML